MKVPHQITPPDTTSVAQPKSPMADQSGMRQRNLRAVAPYDSPARVSNSRLSETSARSDPIESPEAKAEAKTAQGARASIQAESDLTRRKEQDDPRHSRLIGSKTAKAASVGPPLRPRSERLSSRSITSLTLDNPSRYAGLKPPSPTSAPPPAVLAVPDPGAKPVGSLHHPNKSPTVSQSIAESKFGTKIPAKSIANTPVPQSSPASLQERAVRTDQPANINRDIQTAIAASVNAKNTARMTINMERNAELFNVLPMHAEGKEPAIYERMLIGAFDKMMPMLKASAEKIVQAAKLEGKSFKNTQALVVTQAAIERNMPDSATSSKFALPHCVGLYKLDDLSHVLVFLIARHQVSIAGSFGEGVGAGAFVADETGLMMKLRIEKPIINNPDYRSNPDIEDEASPRTPDTESSPSSIAKFTPSYDIESQRRPWNTDTQEERMSPASADRNENVSKFKQAQKVRIKVENTSIITQTHAQTGAAKTWGSGPDKSNARATSFGQEQFVGQSYDLSNASAARKNAIFGRIATENAVGAAVGLLVGMKANLGLTGLVDPFDTGHLIGIGAKMLTRRALDSVVPPSARGFSSSGTIDPLDVTRLGKQVSFKVGGESLALTASIFLKGQWKFGGSPDNKTDLWKPKLEKNIADLTMQITMVKKEIGNLEESLNSKPGKLDSINMTMLNTKARVTELLDKMTERKALNNSDKNEIDLMNVALTQTGKGIDGITFQIKMQNEELKSLRSDNPQRDHLENELNYSQTLLNELTSKKEELELSIPRRTRKHTQNTKTITNMESKVRKAQASFSELMEARGRIIKSTQTDVSNILALKEQRSVIDDKLTPMKKELEGLNYNAEKNKFRDELKAEQAKSTEDVAIRKEKAKLIDETDEMIRKAKIE